MRLIQTETASTNERDTQTTTATVRFAGIPIVTTTTTTETTVVVAADQPTPRTLPFMFAGFVTGAVAAPRLLMELVGFPQVGHIEGKLFFSALLGVIVAVLCWAYSRLQLKSVPRFAWICLSVVVAFLLLRHVAEPTRADWDSFVFMLGTFGVLISCTVTSLLATEFVLRVSRQLRTKQQRAENR